MEEPTCVHFLLGRHAAVTDPHSRVSVIMIYLCFCLLRDFTDDARAQRGILDKTSTEALDILSERPQETT